MAQPVTTYSSSAAAQPVTYTSSAAAQPITTYPAAAATPITTTYQPASTGPMTYIQQADGSYVLPGAQSMVLSSPYSYPAQPLDHSQGKWFAPGEPLPPGFMVVAHPEGHTEPQASHSMTDAVKSMKGLAASAAGPVSPKGKDKKKSKKKKSSSCC
mmetsp:Transcript_79195/g.110037  ORF Transcript_79195/g.110037 Transcript_79195/m.110037 type:complete len:156 (+) Transcript_79195:61-528(+)